MKNIIIYIKDHGLAITAIKILDLCVYAISSSVSTLRLKAALLFRGCRYGKNLHVDGKTIVRVDKKGSIEIGENVKMLSRPFGVVDPSLLECIGQGRIAIGNGSGFSSAIFSSRSSITVGDNVKIGANARIFDHDFHSKDHLTRRDALKEKSCCVGEPVIIGDDVFIGTNAIILKGVKIGDRSIIGAGAVVAVKDIPPDSLVAGNPARVIRSIV